MAAQSTSLIGLRVLAVVAAIGCGWFLATASLMPPTGRECLEVDLAKPCGLRGIRLPGVALELAESTWEVGHIARSQPARDALLSGVSRDYFVIAGYGVFFVAMGMFLGRTHPRLGALVLSLSIGAALFDVVENIGLTQELNTSALTPPLVQMVWWTSRFKWICLFLVCGAMSAILLRFDAVLMKAAGIGMMASAWVGLVGLLAYRPLVELGFLMMLGGIVAIGFGFLFQFQRLFTHEFG